MGRALPPLVFNLITKPFDTLDWAFLLDVLANMGFGERYL
jgi:hypothetical protein